jgi:hypothetical protein
MRFQVTFYREGHAVATVEVTAPFEQDAVKTALASGQVPDRLLNGPWTATVDSIAQLDTYAHYLRDLGFLIREAALDAREEARGGDDQGREWRQGRRFAYMEVVSLMQQQADAFGLPLFDLALEEIDPENDLI